VLFATDHFLGEKNGDYAGSQLSIALNVARIKDSYGI
jgi:hypothetical protein